MNWFSANDNFATSSTLSAAVTVADGHYRTRAPTRDCRVQRAHAWSVWRRRRTFHTQQLRARSSIDLSLHPVAINLDCSCLDRALPRAGLSPGVLYRTCDAPSHAAPESRDAAVLDQFPGANVRLDVFTARYRPVQHDSANARSRSPTPAVTV